MFLFASDGCRLGCLVGVFTIWAVGASRAQAINSAESAINENRIPVRRWIKVLFIFLPFADFYLDLWRCAERFALVAAKNENNKERTNNKTSHKYPANPSP